MNKKQENSHAISMEKTFHKKITTKLVSRSKMIDSIYLRISCLKIQIAILVSVCAGFQLIKNNQLFNVTKFTPSDVQNLQSLTNEKRSLISAGRRLDSSSGMRLFACGDSFPTWPTYGIQILRGIFPEIDNISDHIILTNIDDMIVNEPKENDIMLIHWGMYQCEFEPDSFVGKTVVMTGESPRIEIAGSRVYYMGPNGDSPNSMMTPYVTMRFHIQPERDKVKISDHMMKPKNQQKHFLIYAATNCRNYREEAFDALSDINTVHQGGPCWGLKKNRTKVVSYREMNRYDGANNNHILFSDFRFALVMENTNRHGYISEKILNAFNSGSIPIWYGSRVIFDIFNERCFVYYDVKNPEPALQYIRYLESNRTAYNEVLEQPILKHKTQSIARWFSFNDDVGGGFLKKRVRSMMGYESPMYHLGILPGVRDTMVK